MCRGLGQDLTQVLALGVLARTFANQFDASSQSEPLERFSKVHVLALHQEREHVAAGSACSETMPGSLVWEDDERGGFLVVKRTERLVIAPRFFQSDILSDDIDNVDPLLDVIYD